MFKTSTTLLALLLSLPASAVCAKHDDGAATTFFKLERFDVGSGQKSETQISSWQLRFFLMLPRVSCKAGGALLMSNFDESQLTAGQTIYCLQKPVASWQL